MADTDKRAAAIAVLGGPETARVILTRTRDGVNRYVTEQERAICDLALHALDSDGAAMLRELRERIVQGGPAPDLPERQEWLSMSALEQLAGRGDVERALLSRLRSIVAEIDRLLAAKPAPEPATNGIEYLSPTETRKMPAPFPPEQETPAPQPAAEPAAADEARIADWEREARSYEHDKAGLIYRVWSRDIHAAVDLMREFATRAEKAEAEVERLRGRDAEPFDWDAAPTVQEWIDENLPEKEPRAGIALVELHPDEVVADRGEARRAAGWLKDIMAEAADLRARLAAAEQQLAAASKFPKGFVPGRVTREDDDALRDCLMTPLPDLVHGADSMRWLRIHSLGIKELCRRALAQEGTR